MAAWKAVNPHNHALSFPHIHQIHKSSYHNIKQNQYLNCTSWSFRCVHNFIYLYIRALFYARALPHHSSTHPFAFPFVRRMFLLLLPRLFFFSLCIEFPQFRIYFYVFTANLMEKSTNEMLFVSQKSHKFQTLFLPTQRKKKARFMWMRFLSLSLALAHNGCVTILFGCKTDNQFNLLNFHASKRKMNNV